MKRSIQATLTGEPSRPSRSMENRRWGLEIRPYTVSLSTPSVESARELARAVAISEAQDEWRKVRSNPADVRRRIDELNAMAQKAKCASGWKVTISASPQPSSSSDRSASDRLGSYSSSASASSTSGANAVSARSSVECSFLEEARSVRTFISWSAKFFFHGCLYTFNVCVRLEGGGGSTQTNIVRLKQNVDNWRRPLIQKCTLSFSGQERNRHT